MDRVFHHYTEWEDYKAGMYLAKCDYIDEKIHLSAELLADPEAFYLSAKGMVNDWPVSSSVMLSNSGINRQAWIGQATCCYELNVPEYVTILAWNTLDASQKMRANQVADRIKKEWIFKEENKNVKDLFNQECI